MKNDPKQALIERYKKNFYLPKEEEISFDKVMYHWELEKSLTKELLNSTPENRWQIFSRCYTRLYNELDWLNRSTTSVQDTSNSQIFTDWVQVIGPPPKKVYEIGSGKGELIKYLANKRYECRATEITVERGEKLSGKNQSLSWGVSDGVHLEKFEAQSSYDVVISSAVIEHIHPDDMQDHLKGVLYILKDGGKYVFDTPHICIGPSDISRVFQEARPKGMHLKEYTYLEIRNELLNAGFENVQAIYCIPRKLYCLLESLILRFRKQSLRRKICQLFRLLIFSPNIFLFCEKSHSKNGNGSRYET